jgi:tetratricopeptide (TPR) repeat protein
MKNLKNKIINGELPGREGKSFFFLECKEVENSNRGIWLLSNMEKEHDYSLWIVDTSDEDRFFIWPYKGTDYDALVLELVKKYYDTFWAKPDLDLSDPSILELAVSSDAFWAKCDFNSRDPSIIKLTEFGISILNGTAYANRAAVYAGKGDKAKAIADYAWALELDPDNAEAKEQLEILRK